MAYYREVRTFFHAHLEKRAQPRRARCGAITPLARICYHVERMRIARIVLILITSLLVIVIALAAYYIGVLELLRPSEKYDQNSQIQDKSILVEDLQVNYLELGEGKLSTVIFLHGWSGKYNQSSTRQIITAFYYAGYHTIALEQPGMGRSQTPALPWSNENYADFLVDFMETQKIEKTILVGQSFGGGVATKFAIKYPDRLDHLVLVDANSNNKTVFKKRLFLLVGNLYKESIESKILPINTKILISKYMLRLPNEDLDVNTLIQRADVMSKTFVLTHSEDLLNQLSKLSTPTLLVWGEADTNIPVREARKMNSSIANSVLVTLDGGHRVIYKRPKAVVDLITSKLAERP